MTALRSDMNPMPPPDWWPEWFSDLRDEQPLASNQVVIAEVEATRDELKRYRHLFTALVEPDAVPNLVTVQGSIGHEATSSGPHPGKWGGRWEYEPRFWIDGTDGQHLEPLAVGWESANQRVIWPDQGLLMTYGLVPRLVKDASGQRVCFDDLKAPTHDVIVVEGPSLYREFAHSGARVVIRREYLQDYATVRSRSLIQVFYAERTGALTADIARLLGDEDIVEFELPGRLVAIRRLGIDGRDPILVRIWGVRPLLSPGEAPISDAPSAEVDLIWPGFTEPMGRQRAMGHLPVGYVQDAVLGHYEGRSEFQLNPEFGSVSLGNQWSVPTFGRVGRNLIVVDLKRLYEGTRRETIQLWHSYAVDPPQDIPNLRGRPNVATRTRRIVYGLADIGEAIGRIAATPLPSEEIVGISRAQLDYYGWWGNEDAEPVARHIPFDLSEDDLLHRAVDLHKLVVESFREARLRSILVEMGVPSADIRELRSLRLLERLVNLSEVARDAGLRLPQDATAVLARAEEHKTVALTPLFSLNELRLVQSHKGPRQSRLADAISKFGLDASDKRLGNQLDLIYDRLGDTLDALGKTLHAAHAP